MTDIIQILLLEDDPEDVRLLKRQLDKVQGFEYELSHHTHLASTLEDLKEKNYDVIISEPSNPWLAGQGFLFTKEYYQIAREKLNQDGIFLQWIGAYDFSVKDLQIMLNTINKVFPYILLHVGQ